SGVAPMPPQLKITSPAAARSKARRRTSVIRAGSSPTISTPDSCRPRSASNSMVLGTCLSTRLPDRISSPTRMRLKMVICCSSSCFAHQPLQTQPLLRPEAAPVVPPLLHLVADAGGVVTQFEIGGAEQHVPPGQEHAKVATTEFGLHACHFVYCAAPRGGVRALGRPGGAQVAAARQHLLFVPDADAVVPAMETRADPEALAPRAEPAAPVGVVQA